MKTAVGQPERVTPVARTTEWPGRQRPAQAGYTNTTALTTGQEKRYSPLVGRVHIRLLGIVEWDKDARAWTLSLRRRRIEKPADHRHQPPGARGHLHVIGAGEHGELCVW